MTNLLRFVSIIAPLLIWAPAMAATQSIHQGFYYKLSTQFRGDGMKLDVVNGGPKNNLTKLEPNQNVTGQFWRLTRTADGWFLLSTQFRGSNVCLDIFNGGANDNEPHLASCENLTGQHWHIAGEDGAVRLTTEFRGPDMCLDIFNGGPNNNQPHLAKCADLTGQSWTLTKTDTRVEGFAADDKPAKAPANPSGCKKDEVYSSSMGQCIPKELGR
jgi:Ricin-type beta-trefoil lectin domain